MNALEERIAGQIEESRSERGEHDWALTFTYRMSAADAEEFATGHRPDDGQPWKPARKLLVRLAGPVCLRCDVHWGPKATRACLAVPMKKEPRAARRRRERVEAKIGREQELTGEELVGLIGLPLGTAGDLTSAP